MTPAIVTLTTDFGLTDAYVGALKGVLLSIRSDLKVVDITHLVPPQDIRRGSEVLADSVRFYPPGSVHLAVIDPGVGSDRRILAINAAGQYLVGPDNGLFTPFLLAPATLVHHVTNDSLFLHPVSPTFHGRDIMAPVAARLAGGLDLSLVGKRVPREDCRLLQREACSRVGGTIFGRIAGRDHFGNLRTTITEKELADLPGSGELTFVAGKLRIEGLSSAYADKQAGELIALVDSQGFVEIAVVDGDAAAVTGIGAGGEITATRRRRWA